MSCLNLLPKCSEATDQVAGSNPEHIAAHGCEGPVGTPYRFGLHQISLTFGIQSQLASGDENGTAPPDTVPHGKRRPNTQPLTEGKPASAIAISSLG